MYPPGSGLVVAVVFDFYNLQLLSCSILPSFLAVAIAVYLCIGLPMFNVCGNVEYHFRTSCLLARSLLGCTLFSTDKQHRRRPYVNQ